MSRARRNARASTRWSGLLSIRRKSAEGETTRRGPVVSVASDVEGGRSSTRPRTPFQSFRNSPSAGSSGMSASVWLSTRTPTDLSRGLATSGAPGNDALTPSCSALA